MSLPAPSRLLACFVAALLLSQPALGADEPAPDGKETESTTERRIEGSFDKLVFSRDSKLLLAVDEATGHILDARTGKPAAPAIYHGKGLYDAAFDASAKRVLTVSSDRVWPGGYPCEDAAKVWCARTGAPLGLPLRHRGKTVHAAALSPDGQHVATLGTGRVIHLWKAATGLYMRSFDHGGEVEHVQFSPDGKMLITIGEIDSNRHIDRVTVWSVATGKPQRHFPGSWFDMIPSISANGRIAIGTDFGFNVFQLDTGKRLVEVDHLQHGHQIWRALGISDDGSRVFTLELDGTAIWDVETGKRLWFNIDTAFPCVLGRTGRTAVLLEPDDSGGIWDVDANRLIRKPVGDDWYRAAAFGPDGDLLAISTWKHTLILRARAGAQGAARWVTPPKE